MLAAHKFQSKPIRVYWEALAGELGVKPGTVRKWGYELRKMGHIKIKQNRGRDLVTGKPGIRNERNTFNLDPFIDLVKKSHKQRQTDRAKHAKRRNGDEK